MSIDTEYGNNPNQKSSRLAEVINPKRLPEAGFQSYEELKNNAVGQKAAFLAGEIVNPKLEHPKFRDVSRMDKGILALAEAAEKVDSIETDPERASIIRFSLEFRMAEMEYVKMLAQLEFLCQEGGDTPEIAELAEEVRALNESLYGKPNPEIVNAALNTVWANLDSKNYTLSAKKIYDELKDGFTWGGKRMAPLLQPEYKDALPDFDDESIAWAGEHILERNADIEALIYELWESKKEEFGPDYVCGPDDIVEAFEQVLGLMDPEGKSGVRIIKDPEATALSWESPLMAVKIGGKRAPIASHEVLFQKVLHELKIHGGRAISGLKTSIPVLGTGLFTNTPRPDYLTFEEGFATTVEEAVSAVDPKWDGTKLGHYLSITMAQNGGDFRSVFETSWRYRLLMKVNSGQEVTDEMIAKEQAMTYTACVRVFRGNQTNIQELAPGVKPMTFNKDLAYLEGRVIAMRHIADLHQNQDSEGLDRLFKAKYDPTNPVQNKLVANEFALAA